MNISIKILFIIFFITEKIFKNNISTCIFTNLKTKLNILFKHPILIHYKNNDLVSSINEYNRLRD